jgi:hypothetical protein
MQYFFSVIDDGSESAMPGGAEALSDFNERLEAEGHWVFAGGLGTTTNATTIDNRGDEVIFTDGPYVESKEYLGGFWIIEAANLEEALALAAEGSKSCNRRVEVRPFLI